jgi:hypothetical protein
MINSSDTLQMQLSAENFRELIVGNSTRDNRILQVEIEICNELFLLIPSEYDSPTYRLGFLEKAFGEHIQVGKELHQQAIVPENANLIFLIPSDWKDFISAKFPLAKIEYTHSLVRVLDKKDQQMQLFISNNFAFVSVFQQNKLQLANLFPFESTVELAFYLQSIREAFSLNWTLFPPLLVKESGILEDLTLFQIPYVLN